MMVCSASVWANASARARASIVCFCSRGIGSSCFGSPEITYRTPWFFRSRTLSSSSCAARMLVTWSASIVATDCWRLRMYQAAPTAITSSRPLTTATGAATPVQTRGAMTHLERRARGAGSEAGEPRAPRLL